VAGLAAEVAGAPAPAAPALLLVPLLARRPRPGPSGWANLAGRAGKWPAGGAISTGPPALVIVIDGVALLCYLTGVFVAG
jgi:hypothetical protein